MKPLAHVALEHDRDDEAINGDRLDQNHAQNEVREHCARRARIPRDAGRGISCRQTLADTTAESGQTDREACSNSETLEPAWLPPFGVGRMNRDRRTEPVPVRETLSNPRAADQCGSSNAAPM